MKRFTDLLIAAILIVLTLPLMVIFAVAIKLESPGPIFSRRSQLSPAGRRFELLSFRTTSHREWRAVPRRTRIGWFLHFTRIEDLPQLANVLRGDLTFTGGDPDRRRFGI